MLFVFSIFFLWILYIYVCSNINIIWIYQQTVKEKRWFIGNPRWFLLVQIFLQSISILFSKNIRIWQKLKKSLSIVCRKNKYMLHIVLIAVVPGFLPKKITKHNNPHFSQMFAIFMFNSTFRIFYGYYFLPFSTIFFGIFTNFRAIKRNTWKLLYVYLGIYF